MKGGGSVKKTYLSFMFLLAIVCMSTIFIPRVNAEMEMPEGTVNYHGKYFYSNGSSVSFSGTLWVEGESNFSASCVDEDGSSATLSGYSDGTNMRFTKSYDKNNNKVNYSGRFTDGNTVKGNWKIGNNSGSFYMVFD